MVAAVSILFRPGVVLPGPGQTTRPASSGEPAVQPLNAGETAALLPQDYLDLCRNAGL